ncbi:hypothetical protein COCNU_scaffold001220G000020 [Cocos nucifera]|nr:hypothetical protein [Cocos nucifera]
MCDLEAFPPLQSAAERQRGRSEKESTSTPFRYFRMAGISPASWKQAEEKAEEILRCIQPTQEAEMNRWSVIEHMQKLIKTKTDSEVFPFGSVPLKTYLPDGDIDLTLFYGPNSDGNLVHDVLSIIQAQENSEDAKFEIKDVQYINAEVQLVKCLVQNIGVDISFNQIGGQCKLCFLELIDRKLGRDHLFKKSMILIKAWCYYESRILGAPYALISTYALETLVLYILHLFHETLSGPLSVSFLLEIHHLEHWHSCSTDQPRSDEESGVYTAVAAETDGDLLLTKEFLKNFMDLFSVSPRDRGSSSSDFPEKCLNVVDPLKENNNLGRSVSTGNLKRIRSAFSYGSHKLRKILLLPHHLIADELSTFFINTLRRHGRGERPDLHDAFPIVSDASIHLEDANCLPNFTRVEVDASLEQNIVSNKTSVSRTMKENLKASTSSSATDCSSVTRMASWNATTRLADLAGDIDLHLRNLHQAQSHLDFKFTGSELPVHIRRRMFIHKHLEVPVFWQLANFTPGSQQMSKEDMLKQCGTGTCVPETQLEEMDELIHFTLVIIDLSTSPCCDMLTYHTYRERLAVGKPKVPPTACKYNHEVTTSGGTKLPERGSQEASPWMQVPESGGEGQWRPVRVDLPQFSRPSVRGYCQDNGLTLQEELRPEGGSLAPVPLLEFLPESNFATMDENTGLATSRRGDRHFEEEGPILCAALDGMKLASFSEYEVPAFEEQHGLSPCMVAPTKIIAGLGLSLGIDILASLGATGDYRTLLTSKATAIAKARSAPLKASPFVFVPGEDEHELGQTDGYDFGFLHIKAINDAGHDKASMFQVRVLEAVDRAIDQLARLLWEAEKSVNFQYYLCVNGDH